MFPENELNFVLSSWPCRGWAIAGRIAPNKDDWCVLSNVILLQGRLVANKRKIYAFIILYTRCFILVLDLIIFVLINYSECIDIGTTYTLKNIKYITLFIQYTQHIVL